MIIKELPRTERPRERLLQKGPEVLSDAELLAIILRTGIEGTNVVDIARQILKKHTLRDLSQSRPTQLKDFQGIGPAKAAQIIAVFELARRLSALSEGKKTKITKAADVHELLAPSMADLKTEKFVALLLDARNNLISVETIGTGDINTSIINAREIFRRALEEGAVGIILAHNHPTGDPNPSQEDIDATKELMTAGEIVGVQVLDHIIIGKNRHRSLAALTQTPSSQSPSEPWNRSR